MTNEKDRILSYTLASDVEVEDFKQVAGGSGKITTVGSQKIVGTKGGDTTIEFDDLDA